MNQSDSGDDQDITGSCSGDEKLGQIENGGFIKPSHTSSYRDPHSSMVHTPTSKYKANSLSSLYQHNPDLKNSLENYTMTGRLTAGHLNHYTGNRYHPFSRPTNRSTPTETKRNGLPLFSPVKALDKPVTAVSPYVYSLLHQSSKTASEKNDEVSPGNNGAPMFVSPIPNSFQSSEGHSNAIKSFSIMEDDLGKMNGLKNVSNQMSVEDIAARYSITKSKNTREHTNNNRLYKSSGRHSLSLSSRNHHRHRLSLSSYKSQLYPTSPSDTTSVTSTITNTTTNAQDDNSTYDTSILHSRLGISKKSKLISKNAKLNIPKAAKNQKMFSTYLNSMMNQTIEEGQTSTPSTTSISKTTTTAFFHRFPSISKLFNRFSIRKEKKAVS